MSRWSIDWDRRRNYRGESSNLKERNLEFISVFVMYRLEFQMNERSLRDLFQNMKRSFIDEIFFPLLMRSMTFKRHLFFYWEQEKRNTSHAPCQHAGKSEIIEDSSLDNVIRMWKIILSLMTFHLTNVTIILSFSPNERNYRLMRVHSSIYFRLFQTPFIANGLCASWKKRNYSSLFKDLHLFHDIH